MNFVAADYRDIEPPGWIDKATAFAGMAIAAIGEDAWELSMLFCGEAFMAELNWEYRKKEGSTDVLSFGLGEWYEGENGRRYLAGDVVICPVVLARNAALFGVSDDEELRRLIVHGILHLSGMDHETNDPSEAMLERQEALLDALSEERIF